MRFITLCAILLSSHILLASTINVNFEGFPDSTILTNQYPGGTFSNAIILTAGISLNEFEFPPYSGANVVSDDGGPMSISFASPVSSFGGYFTYAEPLTINAFNSESSLVASTTSPFSNNETISGDPGSSANEFLQVRFAAGISSVTITGDPAGGSFVLDDATFTSNAVATPEPGTALLFAFGFAGLITLFRLSRVPQQTRYLRFSDRLSSAQHSQRCRIGTGIVISALLFLLLPQFGFSQSTTLTAPTLNPPSIANGVQAQITANAQIISTKMIAGSANLIRIVNGVSAVVGVMHDDGQNGDLIASDGVYTLVFAESQTLPSNIQYEVSVAMKGSLMRTMSPATTLVVSETGTFNPPTNVKAYINETDPELMQVTASNGAVIDYFGTKDASGLPAAITSEVVTDNGSQTTLKLGETGLEEAIAPNGTRFQFGATSTLVTSPDGSTHLTVPNAASNSQTSSKQGLATKAFATRLPNAQTNPSTIYAKVTGCSAKYPIDNADVVMNFEPAQIGFSRTIPMNPIGFGTGEYSVMAPAPSQFTVTQQAALAAFQASLANACDILHSPFPTGYNPNPLASAAFCPSAAGAATLLLASGGIVAPEIGALIFGCEVLSATVNVLCSAPGLINAAIDWYNGQSYFIEPIANFPGQFFTTIPPPLPQVPPVPSVLLLDFLNLCVRNVSVDPAAVSIPVGVTQQLTASADDGKGNIMDIGPSFFSWSSLNPAIAAVDPSTGLVTGVSAGGPVKVQATEQVSHLTGSAMITVGPLLQALDGQWAGTITTSDEGHTETMQVSASFLVSGTNVVATIAVTEPGDVPDLNTFTMTLTPTSFTMSNNVDGIVTIASGSITLSGGQVSLLGKGSDNDPGDPSVGSGSLTFTSALAMSGTVTETESDGGETGTGTLTISSNGKTISGQVALLQTGGSASWTLTKQ